MNDFKRIAEKGSLVKVFTTKNETFVGTISPVFSIVNDNGKIDVEILISQSEEHIGEDYGCVALLTSDIRELIALKDM